MHVLSDRSRAVVLVRPPTVIGRLGGLNTQHPINLAYLAASLRAQGWAPEIWDYEVEPWSEAAFQQRLRRLQPLALGFTFQTPYWRAIQRLSQLTRAASPETVLIAGGPHATAQPRETLAGQPDLDVVVLGEAEWILPDLCQRMADRDFAGLAGIAWRDSGGQIHLEAPGAAVADLDALPMPARDLLPLGLYGGRRGLRRAATPGIARAGLNGTQIFTARGCFSHCTFCAHMVVPDHGAKARRVRRRSEESLSPEVAWCVEHLGSNHFSIEDDIFPLNDTQLAEVCRIFTRHRVTWNVNARVEMVTQRRLSQMAAAGCLKIEFGVETGSERLHKLLGKRLDLEKAERAFRLAREAGLLTTAYLMIGSHPTESREDLEETRRFVQRARPDFVSYTIAAPYPGTELRRQLERRGLLGDDDFETYRYYNALPSWRTEHFSSEALLQEQRRFLRWFYLNPRRIAQGMKRVHRGSASYWLGAASEALRFLAVPPSVRRDHSDKTTLSGSAGGKALGPPVVPARPPVRLLGRSGAAGLSFDAIDSHCRAHHVGGLASVAALLGCDLDVAKASGSWLTLADGRQVLDAHASYGAMALGHNHPALVQAARETLSGLDSGLPGPVPSRWVAALAHDLTAIAPEGLTRAVFYSSGSECIEGALVIAAQAGGPGRTLRVGFEGGFHGKSAGARSVGGIPLERRGFAAVGETLLLPFGDLARAEAFLARTGSRVQAVVVEPIQSNGGLRIPPQGFLRGLAAACRRTGALLIVDEVATGLGRTGRTFACEAEGVVPDLLCVSKTLSGGLVPLGAVLVHHRLASNLDRSSRASHLSTTYGGGKLAAAVGLEVIRLLTQEGLAERAAASGHQVCEALKTVTAPCRWIRQVRGQGLLIGVELADPVDLPGRVLNARTTRMLRERFGGSLAILTARYLLQAQGLLVGPTSGDRRVLRLTPPLTLGPRGVQRIIDAFTGAVQAGPIGMVAALASQAMA
jgi:putrescine aminotransferase